jgi:uncharacterized RDD family membrane protein YckC
MILKLIKVIFGISTGFITLMSLTVFCGSFILPIIQSYKFHFSLKIALISFLILLFGGLVSNWLFKDIINLYSTKFPIGRHISGLRFAGFKKRIFAGIIDGVLYIPILILPYQFHYSSGISFILMSSCLMVISYSYIIIFMTIRGQTIGKMFVKIKVTKVDGNKIKFKQSFIRSSVDLSFSFLIIITYFIILGHLPESSFSNISYQEVIKLFHTPLLEPANWLMNLWFLSEFVTLLFNNKRKALHDFLAGTVVLDLSSYSSSTKKH